MNHRPQMIGSFHILDRLGEGGMATVYHAEQLEPIQRQVALKIIKRGMDTDQVIRRFEAERQALAVLDHPNVAEVFDAGVSDDGLPYFVMEKVDGVAITRFADDEKLSVRERISLFVDVCSAVQHAHIKGLIHRDLKPSNILAAYKNDRPWATVIDFGIAKAIDTHDSVQDDLTRIGQSVGTPQYMSPEQFGNDDVDSRTDVYSLGVILYELLVGMVPVDMRAVSPHAYEYLVNRKEPPPPSLALRADSDKAVEVATARRSSAKRVARTVRGDLDSIVMKAMARDRAIRYETVDSLAKDLRRYLDHQPVLAHAPSSYYLIRRFVRRNRAIVTAASIAILAIVAGGISATVGYLKASAADQIARREAETARQVSGFLVDLFKVSNPSEARGNSITAREVLDRGIDAINEELEDQSGIRATLKTTMGSVYRNLGLYGDAEKLLHEALDTRTSGLGSDDVDTLTTANWLGIVVFEQGRFEEAAPIYEDTLTRRRRVLGDRHPDTLKSINNLAALHRYSSELDAAESLYEEALTGQRQVLGDDHLETLLTKTNLGDLYRELGRYQEARILLEEAAETQGRVFGIDHPQTLSAINRLADLYYDMGLFDEAEPLYIAVLEGRDRVLGADDARTLWSMDRLASLYTIQGRISEAEPLQLEAAEGLRRVYGDEHPDTLASINNLAELYRTAGRFDEAEPLYVEVLETQMRLRPDAINAGFTSHNLACVYRDTGRFEEAQLLFEQTDRIFAALLTPDHPYLIENNIQWAALKRLAGDERGAAELEARVQELGN